MSINLYLTKSAYFHETGRNSLQPAFANKLQMDCYLSEKWRCSDSKLKLFLKFLLNSPQKVLTNERSAFYCFWSNTQYIMIYNIKKYYILFTSHNLTSGKKVFRPLAATAIINNPLQKTSGMFHSNLQVAYQSFCILL